MWLTFAENIDDIPVHIRMLLYSNWKRIKLYINEYLCYYPFEIYMLRNKKVAPKLYFMGTKFRYRFRKGIIGRELYSCGVDVRPLR